jgi:hypothetical protein
MSRTNTEEYEVERDFLGRMKANVEREMARRVTDFASLEPNLREEIADYVQTPLAEWHGRPLQANVDAQFHLLKLEEAIVDDLTSAIEGHSLIDELFRRIKHLQEEERQIESEPGFAYLRQPQYWNDEQAQGVLNHLFERWDEYAHGGRLRGP